MAAASARIRRATRILLALVRQGPVGGLRVTNRYRSGADWECTVTRRVGCEVVSISVVVPSGSDAVLLQRTLDALDAQTRPADEVLVIGGFSALAAGFDAATGGVLASLQPGTRPGRHWLAQLEVDFDSDDTVAVVAGAARIPRRSLRGLPGMLAIDGVARAASGMLGHAAPLGPGFGIRATAWARMRNGVHPDLLDDLDLAFQVAPDMRVLLDATLALRVPSAVAVRPFLGAALHTVGRNRREHSLFLRRWRRYVASPAPTLEVTGTRRAVEWTAHMAGSLFWGRAADAVIAAVPARRTVLAAADAGSPPAVGIEP
jgi:hypothetical protein